MSNLRDQYLELAHETSVRSESIKANSLFQVGVVSRGGERHLIDTGGGVIISSNFGGAVGVGDVVLSRQDSGKAFFYSNG